MGFWAYCEMLLGLGRFVEHLTAFSESCSCHPDDCAARHRCKMRGFRAPELACGYVDDVLLALGHTGSSYLLPMTRGLGPVDAGLVMADFALGRDSLQVSLRSKLAFWRQLPHLLVGLAHRSEALSRQVAREALH